MTFRRRLVVVTTLFALFTLGAAFAVVFFVNNAMQERQLDDALASEAREEAREAADAGGERLMISDRPGPAANDVGPLTKYAAIYAPDGRALASTATFGGTPPAPTAIGAVGGGCFDLWHASEHLRGIVVPIPGHAGHTLLLAAPRTDLDGDRAFLGRAMLAVFAVAVAWSALLASWIIRRLTRVHERIAEIARQVSDGDLDARVGHTGGDAETAQLGRHVDEMIGRLAQLLQSQQLFVAHAAHELRSPITTLYGELSHALRRERSAEDYRDAIAEALDASRRLKDLTESLLVLARISGDSGEATAPIHVRALVDDAVGAVAGDASAREVRIAVEGEGCVVECRARDVESMVRNLVENAVRHSPPGGRVAVKLAADERGVAITVSDDGEGVELALREKIFEPFYRGPRAQAEGAAGAGLGLAIARGVARAHGGDLVLSSVDEGTTFVARLPRA